MDEDRLDDELPLPWNDLAERLADDDPDVVVGMARLAKLRQLERDVVDLHPRPEVDR